MHLPPDSPTPTPQVDSSLFPVVAIISISILALMASLLNLDTHSQGFKLCIGCSKITPLALVFALFLPSCYVVVEDLSHMLPAGSPPVSSFPSPAHFSKEPHRLSLWILSPNGPFIKKKKEV